MSTHLDLDDVCAGHPKAQEELTRLRAELAEHKAARVAYASEFPLNDESEPDVGSIHQNIRALKSTLARMTTLRPASEHDEKTVVQWFDMDEYKEWVPVLSSKYAPHTGCKWTPIPTPKEPT